MTTETIHAEGGTDWGKAAHDAAKAHLDRVWEWMCAQEEADAATTEIVPEIPDCPASAPFDGCDTCVIREVLFAAWPVMEAYFAAEKTR